MKNNYYISARSNEQVQGINVNLSSEFEKGNIPSTVSFNANGSVETLMVVMTWKKGYSIT